MLLLNINIKPYMGSPVTLSPLTLSDLERSNSRSHSEALCLAKELGPYRKPYIMYMRSPMTLSHLTFE